MENLKTKLKLYCEANSKVYEDERDSNNILIQDDMISGVSNPYIKIWNVSGLAEPNASQLNSLESDADKVEKNNVIRDTRKNAYGNIGDQLDLLYKDMLADKGDKTGEWFKAVKKVKDDNPKS